MADHEERLAVHIALARGCQARTTAALPNKEGGASHALGSTHLTLSCQSIEQALLPFCQSGDQAL
ncbi:hypothetical protein VPH43_00070 [Ideonella sp. BN130291]|nr:hypothetical protein [Ideonella sp. BN130291]